MQPAQGQPLAQHDYLDASGPALEDHGRAVTASLRAAVWYRQAQRAIDRRRAATALRHAVEADPAFELALADLDAMTGTSGQRHSLGQMNWERHHIEVVRTAAAGNGNQAADLLREHLAAVGCDPLAFRIVAQTRQPAGRDDDSFENLAGQLPQIAIRPDGQAPRDRPELMTATPTPAGQRSATRVVFPGPRRVELEKVIVDLRELRLHEIVVQL